MNKFGSLIQLLHCASTEKDQVAMIFDYAAALPSVEREALASLLSNPPKQRRITLKHLQALCKPEIGEHLFNLSKNFVGDTAETIALLWQTKPGANRPPSVSEIHRQLTMTSAMEFPNALQHWLNASDSYGRYTLIRLATGTFKSPVSAELLRVAIERLGMKIDGARTESSKTIEQGDFFATKRQPTPGTIDAVLMYVERGRRQSDPVYCTLGIWDGPQLVPVGRAPAEELRQQILTYANAHTTKRFGTTFEVERTEANAIILSVAFDDISQSTRRKAGWSLVNPRVCSMSSDLSPHDATRLEDLRDLLLDKK